MRRLSVVAFGLALAIPTIAAAADPPPGSAAGARIGNAIKAAIDIALPPVGQLISAIWPKKADGTDKPEARKAELEQALKQQRTALYTSAQAKIKPVADLAEELAAVNAYLEPTVIAQQSLTRMEVHLAAGGSDWNMLGTEWAVAKAQLQGLKDVADARIGDLWLRNTLHHIQTALKTQVIRVDARMTAKNDPAGLRSEVVKLSETLTDVPAAVGYELADLREDVASLADWAKNAQGGPSLADKQRSFKDVLGAKYPQ
jgi:hypothetical protein